MSHFLFSTGWGSLVMVLVASGVVAVVVWYAVAVAVALAACGLWQLLAAREGVVRRHGPRELS